ncbi:hypothetical protein CEUSTIGMA_g5780.t1 [Chlamydomonas eustigma]|uniref:Uncharacterized protein n=1 Tax=Chlamydomonas eustigma TaxID=1157962 RepID=A0A250X5K1_9CHLO|nr:hypothetical protein CEUSTIGMA_g5780.t1 [Chlamydomonas eustigma]|eukprot:GAX78338.1 hypothetical protein CEUSTIGMA_g5780.t1 [Chlamydomonas eustigma]
MESSNIIKLIRNFLLNGDQQHDVQIGREGSPGKAIITSREEAGELLWDISSSFSSALIMLEQQVLTLSEAELLRYLQRTAAASFCDGGTGDETEGLEADSVRTCEICLGILGNLVAHDELSMSLLHDHAVGSKLGAHGCSKPVQIPDQQFRDLPYILIKLLPALSNSACLSEYFRFLSAALRTQGKKIWTHLIAEAGTPFLEALVFVAQNTLDPTCLERCLDAIVALIHASQSLPGLNTPVMQEQSTSFSTALAAEPCEAQESGPGPHLRHVEGSTGSMDNSSAVMSRANELCTAENSTCLVATAYVSSAGHAGSCNVRDHHAAAIDGQLAVVSCSDHDGSDYNAAINIISCLMSLGWISVLKHLLTAACVQRTRELKDEQDKRAGNEEDATTPEVMVTDISVDATTPEVMVTDISVDAILRILEELASTDQGMEALVEECRTSDESLPELLLQLLDFVDSSEVIESLLILLVDLAPLLVPVIVAQDCAPISKLLSLTAEVSEEKQDQVLQCAWYLLASSARNAASCTTNIATLSQAVCKDSMLLKSMNALKHCQIILSDAKNAHGIPSSCLQYHEACCRIFIEFDPPRYNT